jgi:YD repeat-containing protein
LSILLVVAGATPGEAANGAVVYTYDALGRLTTASYDTGVCITYSYDANGNRLSERILVTAAGSTGVWGCFNWNASGGAKWGP